MTAPVESAGGDPGAPGPHRPPLRGPVLESTLVRPGGLWRSVDVLAEVGSTNSELLDRARRGEPEGAVLAAEHQTAGRGRLDRGFAVPAGAALTVSVLVRPAVEPTRLGWLPLLMGVAAIRALRAGPGVPALLKWPNDVLVQGSEHKLAGILSEAAFPDPSPDQVAGEGGIGVVIGIGLNVSQRRSELPVETATSLALCGAPGTGREELAAKLLAEFAQLYGAWRAAGGDAAHSGLAGEYRSCCGTLGRRVRAVLPGGRELLGEAAGIDAEGCLEVRDGTGAEHALSAGDIVHLRPEHG